MPRLIGTAGPLAGREFPILTAPLRIGREEGLTVVLRDDPQVSRAHAEIARAPGGCVLRDLGSRNGTLVNGAPVAPGTARPLASHDEIQVGASTFRFVADVSEATEVKAAVTMAVSPAVPLPRAVAPVAPAPVAPAPVSAAPVTPTPMAPAPVTPAADPFAALSARHAALVAEYQAGRLSPEAFSAAAAELRFADAEGRYWQIEPSTGGWLVWNGAAWQAAGAGAAQNPAAVPAVAGIGAEAAASAAQTAGALLRELPRAILSQFLWRLPIVGLTALTVFVIHAVLLVWKNEGFNCQEPYGPWINSIGGTASPGSAAAIWGVPIALFWSFVISFFRCGPIATVRSFVGAPFRMLALPFRGGTSLAGFCLGAGIGLVLAGWLRLNLQALLCLSLCGVFLLGGYPGMILARFLGDLWSRVVKKRTPRALRRIDELFRAGVAALAPAFLLLAILPERLRGLATLGLLGAGIFLLFSRKNPPAAPSAPLPPGTATAVLAALLPTALAALLLDLLWGATASADDGGSNEIRGGDGTGELTWKNVVAWWNSEGSGRALGQGATPALGAAAGATLVPPLAPPTGGLTYVEDVSKGRTTEDGQTYAYAVHVQTTGGTRIHTDGRTPQQFYAIVETNDPEWKPDQMMQSVRFSFSAPTGFSLQPQSEFTGSGGHKHVDVVCVPPADAAYAPGVIPGVVYAAASSPEGEVRGHTEVQLQVGAGELVVPDLERDWLRAPLPTAAPDTFNLFARLDWPAECRYTDADRAALNATIELKTLGEKAAWLSFSAPGADEYYRYWTLQANPELQASQVETEVPVEVGLEGRINGGLLQKTLTVRILPPPAVRCEPGAPFLVPEFRTETEVIAEVRGRAPKDEWRLEVRLDTGEASLVGEPQVEDKKDGTFVLTFRLGTLPEGVDRAECVFALKAVEKGGLETEETRLPVTVTRPGLILLSKLPVAVPNDGKTPVEVELTVLRYLPGATPAEGKLEVDEAALAPKALAFSKEIEAQGAALRAFRSAALQIHHHEVRGSGLDRRAVYRLQGSAIIPGDGGTLEAAIEIKAPAEGAKNPDAYVRKLPMTIRTVTVAGQVKDYFTEKRLCLQALADMILRPYSIIQAARANATQVEWALEWYHGMISGNAEDQLEALMKIHDRFKELIEKDTSGDPEILFQYRKDIYAQTGEAWAQVADTYGNIGAVCAAGETLCDWTRWVSEAIFPKIVEMLVARTGRSPHLAQLAGDLAGYYQRAINEYAALFAARYLENHPDPWNAAWKELQRKLMDQFVADMADMVWGQGEKWYEGKNPTDALQGLAKIGQDLKIKARIYACFIPYKFFMNWRYGDSGKPMAWTAAVEKTFWDVAAKGLADTFELICNMDEQTKSELKSRLGDKFDLLRKALRAGEGADLPAAPKPDLPPAPEAPPAAPPAPSAPAAPAPASPSAPTGGTDLPAAPAPQAPAAPTSPAPAAPGPTAPAPAAPPPAAPAPSAPAPAAPAPAAPAPAAPGGKPGSA